MKRPLLPISRGLAGLFLVLLLGVPYLCGSAASSYFFYFNPDSPVNNLSGLKQAMDTFLSAAGFPFAFQPFARFHDFDRQVNQAKPAFLFLPSWYLTQADNHKKFKPLMIPVHNGTTTYRKVLLVGADSNLTLAQLTGPTIAMTPVGPAGLELLDTAIFKSHGLDSNRLNFITTTKDSDALFALALGQVKAALISEENLERIGKINPKIIKTVKQLAVSDPIPRPLLCYAEGVASPAEVEKFKRSLLDGKNDPRTAQLMEMLEIDAWQPPSL